MALERSFLRKYAEKMKAPPASPTGAPATPEEEKNEPTLAEIMRDDNVAFGEMLGSYNDPRIMELAMRVKDNTADDKDFDALVGYREEFLDRKERAGKLIETLGFYSKDFKEHSKAFDGLTKLWGDESIQKTLDQGLNELAMKNPKEFKKIEAYYKKLEVFEETIEKPMNKKIEDFCGKHAIDEDEFLAAMEIKDIDTRKKTLQHLILEKKDLMWKLTSLVKGIRGGGASGEALSMAVDKIHFDYKVQQREQLLNKSGGYLKALISKNPEWREAILRSAKGQEPAFKQGFETKMTFEESAKTIKPADIQAGWKDWLTAKGYGFNGSAPAGQELYRDEYLDEYADKVATKEGFWASLLKFIFLQKIKTDPRVRAGLSNI